MSLQNAELLNRIVKEGKIVGFDEVSKKISDKTQAIIICNVDHKENTQVHSLTTTQFLSTIFTTPADKDFFVTSVSFSFRTDPSVFFPITYTISARQFSGDLAILLLVRTDPIDPSTSLGHHKNIFPLPIKLLRNEDVIVVINDFTQASIVDVHVTGFTVDVLEKANG